MIPRVTGCCGPSLCKKLMCTVPCLAWWGVGGVVWRIHDLAFQVLALACGLHCCLSKVSGAQSGKYNLKKALKNHPYFWRADVKPW